MKNTKKQSKVYLIIRILITTAPFIVLILAIYKQIRNPLWYPPVLELTALGLIIFSNLYLLIESLLMHTKKRIKKRNFNFILVAISILTFSVLSICFYGSEI